ncbi:MAG: hypothetical protein V3W28_05575 [Thermoplasmata archaeon]
MVVSTTSILKMNHVSGTTDKMIYMTGTSGSECLEDHASQIYQVDATLPTLTWIGGGASVEAFFVGAPGPVTYYLNAGMLIGGEEFDQFLSASMVAVFYPS